MHSDCDPRSLLVVFAHPDDEFAVFPWLERAVREGAQVHAVWLTDGGWGGQDIERRQRESIRVLQSIGLREENMHFLGADLGVPDGGLHLSLGSASSALLDLAERVAATELMAPAWEGGHQDHDAAHLAAQAVNAGCGVVGFEYSLYHGFGLPGALFTVLSLIPRVDPVEVIQTTLRERVSYVVHCLRYRSQWKSFVGLLPLYAWRLRSARAFMRRPMRHELTLQRPHEGRLLYERRSGLAWEDFASATVAYRGERIRDQGSTVHR